MTGIQRKVLLLVRVHPRQTCAGIARFGRIDCAQCSRALYALKRKGLVEHLETGVCLPRRYDVTLTGSEKADMVMRRMALRLAGVD